MLSYMIKWITLLIFGLVSSVSLAETVNVAVASNFQRTASKLGTLFAKETGHHLKIISASSGKLATQIQQGAPFDVFLSADSTRPQQLLNAGIGQTDSRFTYAIGKLVLWSKQRTDTTEAALRQGQFQKLAIANPDNAPYGKAAMETLKALNLDSTLKPKFVIGENISQTMQFAQIGGADFAFIAYSQLKEQNIQQYYWLVPEKLHKPIRQDALLINPKPAAQTFMRFLKSNTAQKLILEAGYSL